MRASIRFLILSLTMSFSATSFGQVSSATPRNIEFKQFLGVNAHLLWFPEANYKKQLDQLQALGLNWLRLDLHWSYMEPEYNQFRYMNELDKLMGELNRRQTNEVVYLVGSPRFVSTAPAGNQMFDKYAPKDSALGLPNSSMTGFDLFAQRMKEMSTRYPNVEAWEIWNEPNIPSSWAPKEDADAYGKLATKTAAQLPSNRLKVLGGMAYFSEMPMRGGNPMLKVLLDQKIQNKVDVLSYHPYTNLPDGKGEFDLREKVTFYNNYMRQQGVKQIWATEFGWSTYTGKVEYQPLITTQQQGDYLLKRIAMMMEMDFEKIFLFALSDLDNRASERDRSYGLLDVNGDPKPSYRALKTFLTATGPKVSFLSKGTLTDTLEFCSWWQGNNRKIALFWGRSGSRVNIGAPQTASPTNSASPASSTVAAKLVDPFQGNAQSIAVAQGSTQSIAQYTVTLNGQLQMLVLE